MSMDNFFRRRADNFGFKNTELLGYKGLGQYFDWGKAPVVMFNDPNQAETFQKIASGEWCYSDVDGDLPLPKTLPEEVIEFAKNQVMSARCASLSWPEGDRGFKMSLRRLVTEVPVRVRDEPAEGGLIDICGFPYDEEHQEKTWEEKGKRRQQNEKFVGAAQDGALAAGDLRTLSFLERLWPFGEKEHRNSEFRREFNVLKLYLLNTGAHILRLQVTGPVSLPEPYKRNLYFIRQPEGLDPFIHVTTAPFSPGPEIPVLH